METPLQLTVSSQDIMQHARQDISVKPSSDSRTRKRDRKIYPISFSTRNEHKDTFFKASKGKFYDGNKTMAKFESKVLLDEKAQSGHKKRDTVGLPFHQDHEFPTTDRAENNKCTEQTISCLLSISRFNQSSQNLILVEDDENSSRPAVTSRPSKAGKRRGIKFDHAWSNNRSNNPTLAKQVADQKKSFSAILNKNLKLKLEFRNIRDRKISVMCIWIVVIFLLCWFSNIYYRFSYVVGRKRRLPWFRRLGQCLALFNSLMNPVLYFLMRSDFRQMLKELIGCRKNKLDSN